MFKSIKFFALASLLAGLAACGNSGGDETFVVVEPEPISVEPAFTGKFK